MNKYCFIDFEFNNSQERTPNLVSCSLDCGTGVEEFWLHNNPEEQERLAIELELIHTHEGVFVAYASVAEARCFQALGLDPSNFQWIDLYAEWLQLTFNNESCEYGTYFHKGFERTSVAPKFDSHLNKGRDNMKVGRSMGAMIAQLFGIDIDQSIKTEMRDLILSNLPKYSQDQINQIMKYCSSDIKYLPAALEEINKRLLKILRTTPERLETIQTIRGAYMADVAKMESEGYPVNVEQIRNLRRNFPKAQDSIISNLVNNHYPFYVKAKKKGGQLHGEWVSKYEQMEKFIDALDVKWPRTDSGKYSTDENTLKKFGHISEIKAFMEARKQINQLRWFKEPAPEALRMDGDIFDSIGSDGRLRTFLGAYGTQTSRNAPKAKRFIPAMSSWLRCLIQPPKGWVILGPDWSSQEFYIAGWLSKDPAMIKAYESGDPYLYLAKMAKAVPMEADPVLCKSPKKAPEDQIQTYQGYNEIRDMFKSVTLGLQFGLGIANLSLKLTADLKRFVSEDEARKLVGLHKRIYRVFWAWAAKQEPKHKAKGCLILWDGWFLGPDISNGLSIKNFPVQGHGAVCMREAVKRVSKQGVRILSPLHDAIYIICKEEEREETERIMVEAMIQETQKVLGNDPKLPIRVDMSSHGSEDVWIEGKGREYYELLGPYLECIETVEDRNTKMRKFLNIEELV